VSRCFVRSFSAHATFTSNPIGVHLAASFNAQEPPKEQKRPLDDFWKFETLGISEPVTVSDNDKALQKCNDTVRFEDGLYQVTLSPEHQARYDSVIQDQL